jgi:hypothetical protein
VVSELATYWNVLPGHEDELRAATQRFADVLSNVPVEKNIHTGLRDSRHVIFDNRGVADACSCPYPPNGD